MGHIAKNGKNKKLVNL